MTQENIDLKIQNNPYLQDSNNIQFAIRKIANDFCPYAKLKTGVQISKKLHYLHHQRACKTNIIERTKQTYSKRTTTQLSKTGSQVGANDISPIQMLSH